MKKIRYGFLIIYNLFRLTFMFLFSFGHVRADGRQLVSPSVRFRNEHGTIELKGLNNIMERGLLHTANGRIELNGAFVNKNATIVSMERIIIGRGVTIGPNVCIYDHDHNLGKDKDVHPFSTSPITICDDVWIGANVVICKGVMIGKGAVIAAGSVVTKDVPEFSLFGGVPAHYIKKVR